MCSFLYGSGLFTNPVSKTSENYVILFLELQEQREHSSTQPVTEHRGATAPLRSVKVSDVIRGITKVLK